MSAVRSKSTMVEEEKRMPFFNQVVPATMEPEELNQELNSGAESSFGDFWRKWRLGWLKHYCVLCVYRGTTLMFELDVMNRFKDRK